MPFAFTEREIANARRQDDSARALCLSFTCKEALCKAAGRPYDYTACEILPTFDGNAPLFEGEITLDPALKEEWNVARALVLSVQAPYSNEVISAVYLLTEEPK